jgi:hypothetical protein
MPAFAEILKLSVADGARNVTWYTALGDHITLAGALHRIHRTHSMTVEIMGNRRDRQP